MTRARSTSTKIYNPYQFYSSISFREFPTFPSVTVRSVSMSESFLSIVGASSMKDMATCTILVVACLSWPCFFDNSSICSFSKGQSSESFDMVMMATSSLEVEARSDA